MVPVIIDTNLLLLLVVGATGNGIISAHNNLSAYTVDDYVNLTAFLPLFSDLIFLPHVLTETSNLSRQIRDPYRTQIQRKLRDFIENNGEFPASSIDAVRRMEFLDLGICDAAILTALDLLRPTSGCALLTADRALATAGAMLGHDVHTIDDFRS